MGAVTIAERLREAIESMNIPVDGQTLKITVSVGIANYAFQSKKLTVVEFIDKADKALYDAKNSGRNKVVIAAAE